MDLKERKTTEDFEKPWGHLNFNAYRLTAALHHEIVVCVRFMRNPEYKSYVKLSNVGRNKGGPLMPHFKAILDIPHPEKQWILIWNLRKYN